MASNTGHRDIILYQDRGKLLRSVAVSLAITAVFAFLLLALRRITNFLACFIVFVSTSRWWNGAI